MKKVCGFGEVIDRKLVLRNESTFNEQVGQMKGRVEVTVEKARSRRSLNQNAYYWGVVVKLLSDHTGYESDEMHEVLKQMFNAKHFEMKHDGGGEVEVWAGTSTTKLTTIDFELYLEQVRRWAAEILGVVIPDPNQEMPILTDDGDEPRPEINEDDPRLDR